LRAPLCLAFPGLILACAVAACQTATPGDRPVQRIRAAYTSAVDIGDIPSLMAHRSLEQAGYEVETTFFANPELAVEALAGGSVDVASGGSRAFWAAAAKGADIRMVMEHSENGYQLATVPGITQCRDLDRRTLALSSRGSLPTALGERFLRGCPEARPRVIILPHSGDRLAALLHGAVDAAVLQRSDVQRLKSRQPGRFSPVGEFAAILLDLDFSGVFVNRAFANTRRAVLLSYVQERIRANRRALEVSALLVEEAGRWPTMGTLEQSVIDGEVRAPAWTRDGGMTRTSVADTLRFFVDAGSLPGSLSADQVADFSILAEALRMLTDQDATP